jgi:uncharacterized protein (DUF2062 family)
MREGFFYWRLTRPILELLRQGITPEKIALSVALGAALGVFPAIGLSTTLCAIAALSFRLNLPAIQVANYSVYPVQIALLLPFFRLGEKLFSAPHLPMSVEQIHAMIRADIWHAIAVWCLIAPVFVAVTYAILVPALRYKMSRISS